MTQPTKMTVTKAKAVSTATKNFILKNRNLPPEELAKKRGITVDQVFGVLAAIDDMGVNVKNKEVAKNTQVEEINYRARLMRSVAWKQIKKQFSDEELDYYADAYVNIMRQFRDDVFASEEAIIRQAISIEILMNRNMEAKREARKTVARIMEQQRQVLASVDGDFTRLTPELIEQMSRFDTEINLQQSAEQSLSTEYTKLQEKYTHQMEALKATRQQRIKNVETNKQTFIDTVKRLQIQDEQEKDGRMMEIMKHSMINEYKKLGQFHQYADGNFDQSILTPENVLGEDAAIDAYQAEDEEENIVVEDDSDNG